MIKNKYKKRLKNIISKFLIIFSLTFVSSLNLFLINTSLAASPSDDHKQLNQETGISNNEGKTIELNVSLDGTDKGKKLSAEGGAVSIMGRYVSKIYKYAAGLIVVVAVIMIIIGGYEIMFQGAGEGSISNGKDRIIQALLGIALVFLSALILYTVNPTFFQL